MMHVASGVLLGVFAWGVCLGISADFCGFLQVRRKTVSLGFQHVSYQKVINAIFVSQNGMVTECLSQSDSVLRVINE